MNYDIIDIIDTTYISEHFIIFLQNTTNFRKRHDLRRAFCFDLQFNYIKMWFEIARIDVLIWRDAAS